MHCGLDEQVTKQLDHEAKTSSRSQTNSIYMKKVFKIPELGICTDPLDAIRQLLDVEVFWKR